MASGIRIRAVAILNAALLSVMGFSVAADAAAETYVAAPDRTGIEKKVPEKPGLEAVIVPQAKRVHQGMIARFSSRSEYDPDGSIGEYWSGPLGNGSGSSFTIDTRRLKPGTYKVVLTVMDNHEQRDIATAVLDVAPALPEYHVRLREESAAAAPRETVTLHAGLTPGNPRAEYRFHFGDGTYTGWSAREEADHRYASPGTYTSYVEVRAEDTVFIAQRRVKVQAVPDRPGLSVDRQQTETGESLVFNGEPLRDAEGARYRFNFGDGSRSEWLDAPAARHTYARSGRYHAFLTARVGDREVRSDPIAVAIESAAPEPDIPAEPVAEEPAAPVIPVVEQPVDYRLDLSADRFRAQTGEAFVFEGALLPGEEGARYRFDFGDGSRSEWLDAPAARHTYGRSGRYHAFLSAVIEDREVRSEPIAVDVAVPVYMLDLKADTTMAERGRPVAFHAHIDPPGTGVRYRFDFGDGSVTVQETAGDAAHTYEHTGVYDAIVTAFVGRQRITGHVRVFVEEAEPAWLPYGAAALLALLLGGGLWSLFGLRGRKKAGLREEASVTMQAEEGTAKYRIDENLGSGAEMRLKAVADSGTQQVSCQGNLAGEARREHE
jgi:PKD repeat protein